MDSDHAERHLQMLRELGEIGMEVARGIGREAQSEAPDPNLGMKFARVAKAVRQTIALEARIAEQGSAWRQGERAERRVLEDADRKAKVLTRAKEIHARVITAIEDLGDREDDWTEDGEIDPLIDELGEVLGCETRSADFLERPIDDIIADICRDLELDAYVEAPAETGTLEAEASEEAGAFEEIASAVDAPDEPPPPAPPLEPPWVPPPPLPSGYNPPVLIPRR